MHIATETRQFFRFGELLLQHQVEGGEILTYWNEEHQLVFSLVGHEAEATVNVEDNSTFDIDLRETEKGRVENSLNIPFDATDADLLEVIKEAIEFIKNPNVYE